jgi:hypothetical protein
MLSRGWNDVPPLIRALSEARVAVRKRASSRDGSGAGTSVADGKKGGSQRGETTEKG